MAHHGRRESHACLYRGLHNSASRHDFCPKDEKRPAYIHPARHTHNLLDSGSDGGHACIIYRHQTNKNMQPENRGIFIGSILFSIHHSYRCRKFIFSSLPHSEVLPRTFLLPFHRSAHSHNVSLANASSHPYRCHDTFGQQTVQDSGCGRSDCGCLLAG